MNKSFACQKRGVRRNRYDRFSIPVRSFPFLSLLYVGQVGGLDSELLRSSPLPGFRFWRSSRIIRGIFHVFLRLFLKGFWFDYVHHKAKLLPTEESCGRK